MHVGDHYSLRVFLRWMRPELYVLAVQATVPALLYQLLGWTWLTVPWGPIATVGAAAAFLLAFRNNSTYDRVWEARIIWGGIVNVSRTWGIQVRDLISAGHPEAEQLKLALIHRHFAWLTALRYQLRQKRGWEHMDRPDNRETLESYGVPEWEGNLDEEMALHDRDAQWQRLRGMRNPAAQILSLQSGDLRVAFERGWVDSFRLSQLVATVGRLYDEQGRCERIKDFPYPRQFATMNLFFIRAFTFLIPFGLLHEFQGRPGAAVWLSIPLSLLITWVFRSIEKIGAHSENPFQGGSDDTPISSLARNIEIDLREMFQEAHIPAPLAPRNSIVM